MNPLSGINANDGDILVYNATTGKWEPQANSGGGFSKTDDYTFAEVNANQSFTSGTNIDYGLGTIENSTNIQWDNTNKWFVVQQDGLYVVATYAIIESYITSQHVFYINLKFNFYNSSIGFYQDFEFKNKIPTYHLTGYFTYYNDLSVSGAKYLRANDRIYVDVGVYNWSTASTKYIKHSKIIIFRIP